MVIPELAPMEVYENVAILLVYLQDLQMENNCTVNKA